MKRFLAIAALVVAGPVYAALFGEAFIRVVAPQSFVPREVVAAPYGVRMNAPGASYVQRTPETTVRVEINAQGMRAPHDIVMEKAQGRARIALFGDSYLLGYEARYEDIAATRLEEKLRGEGCAVDVLNFAVSGFGTAEMLRALQAQGLAYDPDIVIFSWHVSDSDDNARAGLFEIRDGTLVETGASYTPAMGLRAEVERNRAIRWLAGNSHLFTIAREKASRFVRRLMAGRVLTRKTTAAAVAPPSATPLDLALLDAAAAEAADAGASFVVVDIPGVGETRRFRTSFRLLPSGLTQSPAFVTPYLAFRAAEARGVRLYRQRGHRHLSPEGNDILADTLASALLTRGEARAKLACDNDAVQLAAK